MRRLTIFFLLLFVSMPALGQSFGGGFVSAPAPGRYYAPAVLSSNVQAQAWRTTSDLATYTLSRYTPPSFGPLKALGPSDVIVNPGETYQQFLGAGVALTSAAAYVLEYDMSPTQRTALLTTLFSPSQDNLGLVRICFGSSDFRPQTTGYTYDDMPSGQTDANLVNFSISNDSQYIIPILQQILTINPRVRIIAGVWTPPSWMLSSGTFETSGEVLSSGDYYVYAQYIESAIAAYAIYGIPIWAVSPCNEPGSMTWLNLSAANEATIIGYLGSLFQNAGISTKIFGYDDNLSSTVYPTALLSSSTASPWLAGTVWHGYSGSPVNMYNLHQAYPYFDQIEDEWRSLTSESVALDMQGMAGGYVIGGVRNWAKAVLLWNLALDQTGGWYQGIDSSTRRGVVTVNSGTGSVTYNAEYYAITHLSMFLQHGAVRCQSSSYGVPYTAYTTYPTSVVSCAFTNPDGSIVCIVYNGTGVSGGVVGGSSTTFQIVDARSGQAFPVTMSSGELDTFVWGTSAQSSPSAAQTSISAPSTPVISVVGGSGQEVITWSAPTSASPILWYNLTRSSSSGTEVSLSTIAAGTTSYTDFSGSGTWYYKLAAVSVGGSSLFSSEQSGTASSPASPAAPVASIATGSSSIVVNWIPGSANGSTITSYNVLRGTSSGSESSLGTANEGILTYNDPTVSTNTNYYYEVKAVNTTGTSSASNEVSGEAAGTPSLQHVASFVQASTSGSTATWSHTCGSGAHEILTIEIGYSEYATVPISSVTYGGVACTLEGDVDGDHSSSTDRSIALWYLKNPPAGAANIVVTLPSTQPSVSCTSADFSGVNQTTPFRTLVSATGTGASASISTTGGSATDIVLGGCFPRATAPITIGSNQTAIETATQGTNGIITTTTQAGGTGTINSTWSWTSGSDNLSGFAVALISG